MRNFDFSPLYRTAIGFDRMANLLDSLSRTEQAQPSYPPYNIELTGEDQYRITMAVAGSQASEQQGFTFDYPDLTRALTKILKNN